MSTELPSLNNCTVAVIGLGYVGLPLAVEFAKPQACRRTAAVLQRRVIGFDINSQRLEELRQGIDRTNETSAEELQLAQLLEFTSDKVQLAEADVFVVTVPTPIDSAKRPDLTPLENASVTVGRALKQRRSASTPVVIYESTVYPGATEEVCIPILEHESGLISNLDFYCGYSPERINPGDPRHKLTSIKKVTSGSTTESSQWIDLFYGSIISAGTHQAPSIKVAEAAKVIENTQRDLNIALMNELSMIFAKLDIDTLDVLEAAGSKWNFLPFRPGLVGGHCIGVDPYYLTHKAEQVGYHPQIVLAGRRINDEMSEWLVKRLVLELAKRNQPIVGCKVLVLGLTFKENCPDLRNTKVVNVLEALNSYGMDAVVVDPIASQEDAQRLYGVSLEDKIPESIIFGACLLLVSHQQFVDLDSSCWSKIIHPNGVFLDLKGVTKRSKYTLRP